MWPTSLRPAAAFTGFMIVQQNYFTLSMRLLTAETSSELIAEQFVITKAGAYELWAVYYCEPRANRQPKTVVPHYGAMRLACLGNGTDMKLEGHYWVDSNDPNLTDGSLCLTDRRAEHFDDYESATAAFNAT